MFLRASARYPTPLISRTRVKPLPTPSTMLATSTRVSPCRLFARRVSSRRVRTTLLPSMVMAISDSTRRSSLPFGPSARTSPSLTWSLTPAGRMTGILPIRDIVSLPDRADHLTADVLASRGAIDQDAFGSREYVHAEAAPHGRNLGDADVDAQARTADAL